MNSNQKYDANTIDFYSYRDFNIYQDTSSINENQNTDLKESNFSSKSINNEENIVKIDQILDNNSITNSTNNNYIKNLIDDKSASIYDTKRLVDLNITKDTYYNNSTSVFNGTNSIILKNSNNQYEIMPTSNLTPKIQEKIYQQSEYKLHQIKEHIQSLSEEVVPQQINNLTKNYYKRKVNIGSPSECCTMINLCCNMMSCFSSCCMRPCCSLAALLGGLLFVGFILATAILLGMFGVLPIPKEITRNICNSSEKFNNQFSHFDKKINSEQKGKPNNLYNDSFNGSNITYAPYMNFSSSTISYSFTTNKKMAIINIKNKIRSKIRIQNKFKNKIIKFMALQYDILLMPNPINKNVLSLHSNTPSSIPVNNDINFDMKINLIVRLYCNSSTNFINFKTREFSNIDISFDKINNMQVKKWNYDTSSSLLQIETTKNCSLSKQYKLNIFLIYKNYGKIDKNKPTNNIKDLQR